MAEKVEEHCKICDKPTANVFNIALKPVPVCERCAKAIFIQQAQAYVAPPEK